MKKLFVILLIILSTLLTYTLCANAGQYDTIKVGLFYGSTAKSSVTIKTSSGVSYGVYSDVGHVQTGVLTGTEFTVSVRSAQELVINGVQVIQTGGSNLSLVPLEGNITVDSKPYRGGIILANASDTLMTVINVLPLEQYLYGVVGGEMPSSWNIEALKAQAICARGFAISNYNKHKSYGFNVCSTTNCQVYGGISLESPSVIQAVDATVGQVLMYNGSIAQSLFYSCSGGYTANVKNVWGNPIPYLSGVPDPYEQPDIPRHTWSATLSLAEITQIMAEKGYNVGNVTSLEVKNDETGRAYELIVTGTAGTETLTRQNTYSPFYSKGVLSQKYTLIPVGGTPQQYYTLSGGMPVALGNKMVISSTGAVTQAPSGFCMLSSTERAYQNHSLTSVSGYTFSGGGWGHGVGMSQYGAKGMADSGFYCGDILSHYYPGTQLAQIN